MPLPQIRPDHAQHHVYGLWLTGVGALHSAATGVLLCAAVAIGWEVYQRATKTGEPSVQDVVATVAASVPVAAPLVLAWWLGVLPLARVVPWI
jgi:hypothetical protein